ncbi:hypothetical protein [uncultured Tenacibaculum sp.]|uniref:hypothetical protein n=1 Tax=uncultured Tenacibaculum sp. TaxID=174713 RepID=UPI0026191E3E|nr:hypothetical protein [uncultured Tenacibaculum sp.]
MKIKPTFVRLIKCHGNEFEIEFPKIKLSLSVNRYYYEKMSNSPNEFVFIS